jgi:hypothetical protein
MSFKFKHFSKTDLIFETNSGYESGDSFDKKNRGQKGHASIPLRE